MRHSWRTRTNTEIDLWSREFYPAEIHPLSQYGLMIPCTSALLEAQCLIPSINTKKIWKLRTHNAVTKWAHTRIHRPSARHPSPHLSSLGSPFLYPSSGHFEPPDREPLRFCNPQNEFLFKPSHPATHNILNPQHRSLRLPFHVAENLLRPFHDGSRRITQRRGLCKVLGRSTRSQGPWVDREGPISHLSKVPLDIIQW